MEINKARKLLLGLILGIAVFTTFKVLKSLNKEALPIEPLKAMSKNVDIEIKNFKVIHEAFGRKDWEIRARQAQVKNEENKVFLTEVNVTLKSDRNQQSTISADTGTINRKTKDIELEGNVKFRTDADKLFDQFKNPTSPTQEPESQ